MLIGLFCCKNMGRYFVRWKKEYENQIKHIQELLQKGKTDEAKKEIYGLKNIYPYSLKYICENVEVMLKEGKDKEYCRTILDNIC